MWPRVSPKTLRHVGKEHHGAGGGGSLTKLDMTNKVPRGSRRIRADRGLRWGAGGVRKKQPGRKGESGSREEVERPGVWDGVVDQMKVTDTQFSVSV